ncbi:uncharacterized protein YndB with AHSA1/START domain [Microlunatus panaciterrae]|uniref:Uncharacterized protein YndB with AHSA1/START domain n=1 Tax=Microlunatus panaciterrae TaxID=400768 RepID=A0ABS2RJL0_9ACTN|nr:SRPBCC family protein [Microlunatus panaciterrae]MBM7798858.1 uncharacterized protein YndB with AHSA1/START domain [Microlunatus panaciterrae]
MNHPRATVTLPNDTQIQITRTFDAPPELVFKAWTTPEYVRRWWGSAEAPLVVCDIDLSVGGSWRYVSRDASGTELGWHGTCLELDPPLRMVSTEVFEGFPDAEAVNTLVLSADGDRTLMTVTVQHSSRENRDGHLNSGMEAGMQVVLERLDDVLEGLKIVSAP